MGKTCPFPLAIYQNSQDENLSQEHSFFLVSAQTISHAGYPPWFPVHNSTWAFLAFMTYIFHSLAPHIYVWEMLSYLSLAQKIPHRPCQLMSFSTRGRHSAFPFLSHFIQIEIL